MTVVHPFHVALVVHDLGQARAFYSQALGCSIGRSSSTWIDFDFFGHQLVCHEVKAPEIATLTNPVDGEDVPVPHCGIVLPLEEWEEVVGRIDDRGLPFLLGPTKRFEGTAGEQATAFLADPSGNVLEFKGFRDLDRLFLKSLD